MSQGLNKEQLKAIPGWVEKWVQNGLSTEPANFTEAERGVRGCYRVSGLPEPQEVFYVKSPLAGAKLYKQVCEERGLQVDSQVDSQVYSQVYSQVDSRVYSQVGSRVYSQVDSQVYSQVRLQVYSQVYSQVKSQLTSSEYSQIITNYRGGNTWSHWYACISYLRDIYGWTNRCLDDYYYDELAALNAGWVYYHEKFAIICDRPSSIQRNQSGQLHCEDGPALTYRDSWSLWSINGVTVDEQIVMRPEAQTLDQIDGEDNNEVKRIRIDRYGWHRYLIETNAEVLDYNKNYVEGTQECLMQTKDGQRILLCACPSTGRLYTMRVPRNVESCTQAQVWLSGKSKLNLVGAS